MELELRINGVIEGLDVAPNESLLSLLRQKGYSSVKKGCETGECGACTVLVDGVARPSCVMLAAQVGGCTLSTVESLGTADKLHPLQSAFLELGATGCGFCTSGMLLSAHALLQMNPSPTEAEVRDALSGNLCRCTGYAKPVQAVLRASSLLRGESVEPLMPVTAIANEYEGSAGQSDTADAGDKQRILQTSGATNKMGAVTTKIPVLTHQMLATSAAVPITAQHAVPLPKGNLQVVGTSVAARNVMQVITGKSSFVDDRQTHQMTYARILTSPHAHATIRSIDVSKARTLPDVLAVLTYKDVSRIAYASVERVDGNEKPLLDQYCLDNVVRYVGDRVAVVVAETPAVAEQALQLITVEYDVLPAVLDQRRALEAGATRVHAELEAQGIADATRNIAARRRLDVGDVEQGFASADHVVETEYIVPPIQQAPLEAHAVVTYFDNEDYLVVRTNNQVPNYLRRTLATLTNLPMRRIRIEQPEVGGDLGLRHHIEGEDLCALLTLATKRPVRLEYSRADEFRSNHARQQYILRMKTGVRRDGEIVASQMVVLADTGAYGTHALTMTPQSVHALALYPSPNMRFLAEILYTNHAPAAPTQGYNLQHEFFALESHMDDVAKQLRMDALAFRRRNWLKVGGGYPFLTSAEKARGGAISIASSGLATCTRLVEEKLEWSKKRGVKSSDRYRHGVGMALAFHGDPGITAGTSGATIKLNEDGSFDIFAGRSENGSQLTTFLTQIAAEVLGVPMVDILLRAPDTASSPVENSANDVTAFYMNGNAVKKAAEQIQRQILSVAGRMLNVVPETLKISNGILKGPHGEQLTVAQVSSHAMYVENRQLMTTASWKGQQMPMTFAAQGVEIEVDIETGSMRVLRVITAVDTGTPMNPVLFEGQVEGDVAQALGISFSEELLYDQYGKVLTTSWLDSHILSAQEMPELQTYLVDSKDPSELFGAKAINGIALSGIAPAIANALFDAVDVRIRHLPFTPERILRAVHAYMARYSS